MRTPSVYKLKPAFQGLLRPLVRTLAKAGITANQITLLAVAVSMAHGFWIYCQPGKPLPMLLLPLTLFVRMALNAIDGMLAREHGQKSRLGGFLNELGDVVSDTALYLPFAMHPALPAELVLAFVLLAILAEFTGVAAVAVGSERRYEGPMGKSDRALLWGVLGFLGGIGFRFGPWTSWVLGLGLVLLVLTMVNRIRKALI